MIAPEIQKVEVKGDMTEIVCIDGTIYYFDGECFYSVDRDNG